MNKISTSAIIIILVLSLVSAITLTADATRSVTVPLAARGTICFLNEEGACTDKIGEVLFGNAVVENMGGDQIGMVLIQFGSTVYRATSMAPVYLFHVNTTDGETVTATSLNLSELEGSIENYAAVSLIGLQGKLSLVLPNGEEVYTTGESITYSDEKGSSTQDEPIGEYYIEYSGLVLEDSDTCSPYSYLDENGQPVKGLSTRECTGVRGVMRSGEYEGLHLTFYGTGDVVDRYKLTSITATTSFTWEPAAPREELPVEETDDEETTDGELDEPSSEILDEIESEEVIEEDEDVSDEDADTMPPEENTTEVP